MSILKSLKAASDIDDLAALLGYKAKSLAYILYKLPDAAKYTTFKIPKKSGGEREICAPTDQLKLVQRRLANILYACRDEIDKESGLGSLSHGFRRGHSIVTNAKPHHGRRFVLNLDLKDFFPSFNFGRIRGFFIKSKAFELNEKVATLIAQIACHQNSLPQGSPCSPVISDLVAHLLDARLAKMAKKEGVTYSRYADDLTFSTNKKSFPTALATQDEADAELWELRAAPPARQRRAGPLQAADLAAADHMKSRNGYERGSSVGIRTTTFAKVCAKLRVTGRRSYGPSLFQSIFVRPRVWRQRSSIDPLPA